MATRLKNSLKIMLALLLFTGLAGATTVTATITDSDSQTWNNCKWRVVLHNPRPDIIPSASGTALTAGQITQSGSCDGSGALSVTLVDSTTISPVGTTWNFSISPNASAPGGTGATAVSGSSQSLSVFLSGIVRAPRFNAGSGQYGYSDTEVITTLLPGATYYNVTTPALRLWSGSGWSSIGSGSGLADCTDTSGVSFVCTVPTTITGANASGATFIINNTNTSNVATLQMHSCWQR